MNAKWLNILLVAIPLEVVAFFLNRSGGYAGQLTYWIFGLGLVAVIPLASLIGRLTSTISGFFGDRVGGLLEASFGNAPELAIGIFLLVHAGLHAHSSSSVGVDLAVIHGLLIGSVINNVLFVLGTSIFIGALRNGRMNFSATNAAGYTSMLALSVVGLALPTLAIKFAAETPSNGDRVSVSAAFAAILIISYLAYIAASVFNVGARGAKPAVASPEGHAEGAPAAAEGMPLLADDPAHETQLEKIVSIEDADQDEEAVERKRLREYRRTHRLDVAIAIVSLTIVTMLTVLVAGMLVSVTDNVIQNTSLTPLSVGLILFPIVCNLGEHAGAVISAWKNRMEGAMSVAAGSSVQVALFVTPLLVLISLPLSGGAFPLVFQLTFPLMQLIVLGLVAFVYALVSLDGETTWLEGLQLLAFYAMIVAVAFALPGA